MKFYRISRRGFTLVEMAIVLIIIGLIASISLRIKDINIVSKRRVELAKVLEIQRGILIFRKAFGKYPGSNYENVYSIKNTYDAYNDLVDSNILEDGTFYIRKKIFTSSKELLARGDLSMWVILPCYYVNSDKSDVSEILLFNSTAQVIDGHSPDICLTLSYKLYPGSTDMNDDPSQGPQTLDTWEIFGTLMASFESFYDDQNYLKGVARTNTNPVQISSTRAKEPVIDAKKMGYNAYLSFSEKNSTQAPSSKSSADDIANNKFAMNRLLNLRSAILPGLNDYIIYLIRI